MGKLSDQPRAAAIAAVVGVLLVAGAVETVGAGLLLASDGARAVTALGAPQALLPLTGAAIAAGHGGRRSRIAAFLGATGGLIARVVFASLLVVPGWGVGTGELLGVVAGLLTGVALVGWTLYLVLHHRDLSDPEEADPRRDTRPRGGEATATGQRPSHAAPVTGHPGSPSAPIPGDQVGERAAQWATASTPWPRADENDPDGTLIRPPRR